MEHIKTAIASASDAKPVEFKAAIDAELKSRIYDSLLNKKMELANAVFNQYDEGDEEDTIEFQSSSEGNVDEDL